MNQSLFPKLEFLICFVGFLSFLFTVSIFPAYISWLKQKRIKQYIREEGPSSHISKSNTPTMGGLCFIITTVLVTGIAFFILKPPAYSDALIALAIGVFCGLVGGIDDSQKISNRANKGISGKTRLLLEFGVGFVLAMIIWFANKNGLAIINFTPNNFMLSGISEIIYLFAFIPFLIAATTNAVNLHDGLDGLASGTAILVFVALGIMLFVLGNYASALLIAIAIGAIAAFWIYNKHPASIFMGDTGSLFIGGLMAATVASTGTILWFIPLAIIYIVETLSVMMQVVYFKLTKDYKPEKPISELNVIWHKLTKRLPGEGKRLFRMAPLHHHFEAVAADKNIAESKVVCGFWVAQLVVCLVVTVVFCINYGPPGV